MNGAPRAVFMGSGGFALPILDRLAAHDSLRLVGVVTAPARRAGRRGELVRTPVAAHAAELGVPTLTPERLRDTESVEAVAGLGPQLIVLADYGRLVPGAILRLPEHGAFNVHPSLLPRHRGASPVAATILAGDTTTGASIIVMNEGIDTGPLVGQARMLVPGDVTAPELEADLARLGASLLGDLLEPWLVGSITPQPQPAEGATLSRPLARADGQLDPSRPARELERQVRAYQPWPGSWIESAAGRLTVWRARALPERHGRTGTLVAVGGSAGIEGGIGLATEDGTLELTEVQPAGGRRMDGAALVRGRPGLVGQRLERRRVG